MPNDKYKEKIDQAVERLEQGIRDFFNSDHYRDYLQVCDDFLSNLPLTKVITYQGGVSVRAPLALLTSHFDTSDVLRKQNRTNVLAFISGLCYNYISR